MQILFKTKLEWLTSRLVYKNRLQSKKITRDEEGRYTMIKGPVHQEHTMVPNEFSPFNRASKYDAKVTELKSEVHKLRLQCSFLSS